MAQHDFCTHDLILLGKDRDIAVNSELYLSYCHITIDHYNDTGSDLSISFSDGVIFHHVATRYSKFFTRVQKLLNLIASAKHRSASVGDSIGHSWFSVVP